MKRKPEIYFVIAYVFLALMALFWSVDSSLVFIFLGLACFFLFLGFYNRAATVKPRGYASRDTGPTITATFPEFLRNLFKTKSREARGGTSSTPAGLPKLIRFVVFSVFSIFLFVVVVNIITSDGDGYDATGYFEMAEQNFNMEEYDSAYLNYRRAMQAQASYVEAMVGYGRVLIVKNELDSAIGYFSRALEIDPEYDEAAYQKALAYYEQKKYAESIESLNAVLANNPEFYNAMLLLGDCYYVQRQYDEALSWYENAYQNGGIRTRILCHIMAYIYDTKGNYNKAIQLYQEALSYDSSIIEIYQRLGELIPDEKGNFYRTRAAKMGH